VTGVLLTRQNYHDHLVLMIRSKKHLIQDDENVCETLHNPHLLKQLLDPLLETGALEYDVDWREEMKIYVSFSSIDGHSL
jgi:hypothetical protein